MKLIRRRRIAASSFCKQMGEILREDFKEAVAEERAKLSSLAFLIDADINSCKDRHLSIVLIS